MAPVFYVLAIMGCGDGGGQCTSARVETAHYATAAQCRAELPAALARNTDLSFPVIAADCRLNAGVTVAKISRSGAKG